jgi:hypothetical protein
LDTPTEITDFDYITFFNQDVFWLNVSVDETLLVHVVDA